MADADTVKRAYADVAVIGAGCAGLRAALAAREAGASVLLLNKGHLSRTGATAFLDVYVEFTALAVGLTDDEAALHYRDIVEFGQAIGSEELARAFAFDARHELRLVESLGLRLERAADGHYRRLLLPGHQQARVLKSDGPFGRPLLQKLASSAIACGVVVRESTTVCEVRYQPDGPLFEVLALHTPSYEPLVVTCRSLVLATGGVGALYSLSTNPPTATGDGLSLALECGAELTNVEFIQSLPLVLWPVKGLFLTSGLTVKGTLKNALGDELRPEVPEPVAGASPSDQLDFLMDRMCRWMEQEFAAARGTPRGGITWDGRHLGELFRERIPRTYEELARHGVDLTKQTVELGLGEHQLIGGVRVDACGRTSVPGLFAAGEVCGGLQGARRMMGSGVMEALVLGARAGRTAAAEALAAPPAARTAPRTQAPAGARSGAAAASPATPRWGPGSSQPGSAERGSTVLEAAREARQALRKGMDSVLVTKDGRRLAGAIATAEGVEQVARSLLDSASSGREYLAAVELRRMAHVARAILEASRFRQETRGFFRRTDFPATGGAEWARPSIVRWHGGRWEVGLAGLGEENGRWATASHDDPHLHHDVKG